MFPGLSTEQAIVVSLIAEFTATKGWYCTLPRIRNGMPAMFPLPNAREFVLLSLLFLFHNLELTMRVPGMQRSNSARRVPLPRLTSILQDRTAPLPCRTNCISNTPRWTRSRATTQL